VNPLRLPVALLVLIMLGAIAGCGAANESSSTATASASKQGTLDRKLHQLRHKLHSRQAALRAGRAREARLAQHPRSRPVAAGRPTQTGSFAALEDELGGQIGVALGPPGSTPAESFGELESGSAWSTIKVPISLRLLEDVGGPSGLSSAQAEEMRRALTLSDNQAAAALFADLERSHGGIGGASAAVGEILREAGDSTTQISRQGRDGFSSYGQTEWSLVNQQRFMSRLAAGCISTPTSRQYVLDLMGEVSSDSWGLGSAGLPAHWKGGWGPGVDGAYLARQMGILYVGGREAVVALAAIPSDGQFETAEAMATSIAQWLARQAPAVAATPSGC
jgi:beta-lactamase class A